ncbi:hypothetical protein AAG747_11485 [Rapidithrix thailandica]|uniref:Uncharacterized protein n=1 Tax=Rapidithrix thailandica TaxID=413964 RepID=A0AAW9S653_9BACT
MNKKLADIISLVLNPAMMPVLCIWLVLHYCRTDFMFDQKAQALLLLYIGIFTLGFPFLSVYLLYRSGFIESIFMKSRKERPIPLLISFVYQAMLTYVLINKLHAGELISSIMLGLTVTLFLVTVISLFYKISLHSSAIGSVLGVIMGIDYVYSQYSLVYPAITVLMAMGLVMAARLALDAHTPKQIYSGVAVGVPACFFTVFFMLAA